MTIKEQVQAIVASSSASDERSWSFKRGTYVCVDGNQKSELLKLVPGDRYEFLEQATNRHTDNDFVVFRECKKGQNTHGLIDIRTFRELEEEGIVKRK